jgi:uncharacterized protein (DUF1501 family)
MSLDRRSLLAMAAAAAPTLVAGRVWAQPQAGVRLLVVFLRGAYDAANVVIPTTSDFYLEARPSLHIARPDPTDPLSALPLDADWGLHPALKARWPSSPSLARRKTCRAAISRPRT